jgi:hypothetical protein
MAQMTRMNADAFAAQECHPQMAKMPLMNADAFAAQECHPQMAQMTLMNAGIDARERQQAAIPPPHPSPISSPSTGGGERGGGSERGPGVRLRTRACKRPSQPVTPLPYLPPLLEGEKEGEAWRGAGGEAQAREPASDNTSLLWRRKKEVKLSGAQGETQ